MKYLINYFKSLIISVVLIGFSICNAGSYDDFFTAIKEDNSQAIKLLVQRGFDPNTIDPQARHGLTMALADSALKAADALLAAPGINVNFLNAQDESPLMYAALKGHLALAKKLILKDADVNKTGWAPLHYAATSGHLEMIRLLLEHHAFVDAESPNGTTPLMMAAQYGSGAAVKLLLDEGAQPMQTNEQGLTALDFALRASRPDAIELLTVTVKSIPKPPAGRW